MTPDGGAPWHTRAAAMAPLWLQRRLLRFEAAIDERVSEFSRSLPSGTRVLDAGAGESPYAPLFTHCRYIGVDLCVGDAAWDYSSLQAQADLAHLPFPDEAFGAAINIVVLEHTKEPARVLQELARVVAAGAPLLLVVPQEWGVHQAPHDYFRFTRHGIEWLLRQAGFEEVQVEPVGGFFTLLGRRLLESPLYFQGGLKWLLFPVAALLAGPAGLLAPWLDFLDRGKETTLGYVCVARRK